jgi:hypothetical protein
MRTDGVALHWNGCLRLLTPAVAATLRRLLVLSCVISMAHLSGAKAQTPLAVDGSKTELFVQTIGGQPTFCGVEFWIVFRDGIARQGEMSGAHGSLAWTVENHVLAMLLKIYGHDFTPSPVLFRVLSGFVVLKGQPIKPETTFQCEEKLGFCGLYSIGPSTSIFSALIHSQPLSVAFQRKPNGFDTVLPIELSSEAVAPDKLDAFLSCMKSITDRAAARR